MNFIELYGPLWKVVKLYGPFWNFMHFNLRLLSLLSALSADSGIRLEVVWWDPLPPPPIMVTLDWCYCRLCLRSRALQGFTTLSSNSQLYLFVSATTLEYNVRPSNFPTLPNNKSVGFYPCTFVIFITLSRVCKE